MTYYTRTYNPQPTARVTSQELKNEFQSIDNALDAVETDVGKGIRAPEATTALPNAASRALKVLSFDASGNPRTTIAEVDLTAAAAAAALSESNAAASAVDAALSAVAAAASAVAADASADAAAASAVAADASADAAAASAASIAGGPVASVNGLTGVVTLDAAAIGAQPTLVSGTDIKTLNGVSLLGSGNLTAGGVSPDSIVVLTSGTSWTCPAGVTKARLRVVGGGGGGENSGSSGVRAGGGGGGGLVEVFVSLTPATSYTYAIGSGGVPGGALAGDSSMTVLGVTYSATGGGPGGAWIGGTGGGGSGTGALVLAGQKGFGSQAVSNNANVANALSAVGGAYGRGGQGGQTSDAEAGNAGAIILELYK